MIGLVGKKQGMTRIFKKNGIYVPVTVIAIEYNRIIKIKTLMSDGYSAIQVTIGSCKFKHLSKAILGKVKGIELGRSILEFNINEHDINNFNVGDNITASIFKIGEKLDVTGISKGKGFQGVVKRWNFRTQDMTHGNSLSHRAPGSIGQCQTPGRVFKGKKMSGHMGNKRITIQNLEIIDIDSNIILIKGAIPGAQGNNIIVRRTIKNSKVKAR
ncbi:50S ribosomal protein L3 [Candidatus Johnevansia muelleri]|uniref:Large ribosomal subunit protein uL3 n=1 Tax=Candidatus Johnevansia muelleri TaxID=1495769 RepID=A0A078KEB2_9GAMM|nr:50S ribosomal protein L3 [Candidatus Evansia muelleri]